MRISIITLSGNPFEKLRLSAALLTINKLMRHICFLIIGSMLLHTSADAKTEYTTTYLRCWYRATNNHNEPLSTHIWGKNKDGSVFKIPGYWYDSYILENIFYTPLAKKDLEEACLRATPKSINQNELLMYAADNKFSYNNTIWFNDHEITDKINKIVSFGDSLSDTGNFFNASNWMLPNVHSWFAGHFSNGLVWTEYLAREKGVPLYNWAVGGAAGKKEKLLIGSVHSQVKSFLNYKKKAKNFTFENTLLTLGFGLNDLTNYHRTLEDTERDFSNAVGEIFNAGGKHLLILNLPDVTYAPLFKLRSTAEKNEVKKKIASFNIFVRTLVNKYKDLGVNIILADAEGILSEVINNGLHHGFVNTQDACLVIKKDSEIEYLLPHHLTDSCKLQGADRYVFWGLTHPTTATHKMLADQIMTQFMSPFTFLADQ